MSTSFFKAILILPGTVLVYIPALLIWLSHGTSFEASLPPIYSIHALAGVVFGLLGFGLIFWTMRLFAGSGGGGTPAPWDPIQNLIIRGPYRHVRNPMLTGVIFVLVAEALLVQSIPICLWMLLFFIVNTLYFGFVEEPELEKRFGDAYRDYKNNVPRWLPRLSPYVGHKKHQ